MPILTLKFKDSAIDDFLLQQGVSLTIGRRKNNDVVIDNLAVSGHHAKIDSVGEGFVLIDLQSKNGSFVNEKIINTHWLKDGDVISIGKHSLGFNYSADEQEPDDSGDRFEKTMIMDTVQYRSMVDKSKQEPPQALFDHDTIDACGGLLFLNGGRGKIELSRKITKIGKDPESDIVVKGILVGQTSVIISKRSNGFYLSHVGGFSKPKINDKSIKHSRILNDLDVIDIGSAKLQFHDLSHSNTGILKVDPEAGQPSPQAG